VSKKLLLIIFLLLALGISLTLVFRTTILVNRAAVYSDQTPVLQNSYLFASPLQANSKNQEKIRITVFVLDGQGLGVSNQLVKLSSSPSLSIENIQPLTSETGQATFNISSQTPGTFQITAKVGDKQIPQSISVTFY